MSAIYGILSSDKIPDITGLSVWNAIYGKEDSQELSEGNVFCGCRTSATSHPKTSAPVISNDEYIAVIDSIIYNRDEVIQQLSTSQSDSDERLIFELFLKFGAKGLKNVNGDFAGAFYSKKERKLTLIRDHIGIRPLFFYYDKKNVVFSTDIRGIISNKSLDVSISEEWAYKFLSGYISDDEKITEYSNVYRVTPGHTIEFSFKNEEIIQNKRAYWKPALHKIRLPSEKRYQEKMRELVESAVKLRLDAYPGKVGAELSGGLDSGVIDIIINRFGREGVYFSWSKSPEILPIIDSRDERNVILDICKQENIQCHYNDYSYSSFEESIVTPASEYGLVNDAYSPIASKCSFPTYLNSQTLLSTAKCVKENGSNVVFTGHGGDEGVSHRAYDYELFYFHEYYYYLKNQWRKTYNRKHRIIETLKLCKTDLTETRKDMFSPFKSHRTAEDFITQSLKEKGKSYSVAPLYFSFDPVKYVKQGGSLNRPECTALYGAYMNVTFAFPFLDYRVLDYALSIPRHNYINHGKNRYVYREAFKDIMPKSLYKLTSKRDISALNRKKEEGDEKPDWYPAFNTERRALVESLDRDIWAGILDFDKLDAWVNGERPEDAEREKNENALGTLFNAVVAQTALIGARLAVERAAEKKTEQ